METKNIYQRILGVMQDVDYIQKLDKKVNNQYRFVSHDLVAGTLHPSLVKHGIAVIPTVQSLKQDGNRTEVCLLVKFVNADKPEDFLEIQAWGYGIDQSDKGPGKAVSYAYKYALLKIFCLETGDDPDEDAATEHKDAKENDPYASMPPMELTFLIPDDLAEYTIQKSLKEIAKIRKKSLNWAIAQANADPESFLEHLRKKSKTT